MSKIEGLPYGAIHQVAEKMGLSDSYVRKVAKGKRRNAKVEEELWQIVYSKEARMARIRRMKKRIDEDCEKYMVDRIDTH